MKATRQIDSWRAELTLWQHIGSLILACGCITVRAVFSASSVTPSGPDIHRTVRFSVVNPSGPGGGDRDASLGISMSPYLQKHNYLLFIGQKTYLN